MIPAPVPVLLHAFGKRYELPVPLWLFVAGGAAVVFASFLIVLPTAVRAAPADLAGLRDLQPRWRFAPFRTALCLIALVALAVTGWTGSQEVAENILPTAFWLLVWIGVPLSCGVIGD